MVLYFDDLCLKYRLSSSALYYRLRSLKITLSKDSNNKSCANSLQLFLLDNLHSHITSGNPISSFPSERFIEQFNSRSIEPTVEQVVEHPTEQLATSKTSSVSNFRPVVEHHIEPVDEQYTEHSIESILNFSNSVFFQELSSCLKSLFLSVNNNSFCVSPLEKYRILQECCDKKWLLTTADLEKILEKKPKKITGKNHFFMFGWRFTSTSKMSNQNLWKVEPISS